ncbi:MAG: D-2-hydroxyacid dehydrogenase [Planctomycetota bacterium]
MHIVLLDAALADRCGQDPWPGLDAFGSIHRHDRTAATETIARLRQAEVAISNKVLITREVLAACPQLRYLGITATGINIVDLEACRERGVAVSNVPAYSTESVAQHVIALLLEDACAVAEHDARVRAGDWAGCPDFCFLARPSWELAGKRLAVIGAGAIGLAVQRMASAFGMQVDLVGLPWRPAKADRVPLAEALPRADVISLHCPLDERTQGLVDADFLAHCKHDVLLLNTGRGGLIEEAALADWLRAHPAARAGVDVLGSEPPAADNPLLGHPQIRITPHIAWATMEARARLRTEVVANLAAWLTGERRNRVD